MERDQGEYGDAALAEKQTSAASTERQSLPRLSQRLGGQEIGRELDILGRLHFMFMTLWVPKPVVGRFLG